MPDDASGIRLVMTGDFFYIDGPDNPGGLALTSLDPARRYTLRLFASRDWGEQYRRTRYTVYTGLQPDAWGQLHLDVATEAGAYA